MDFSELQHTWASQPQPPVTDRADDERLKAMLAKAGQLNRKVKARDYVELVTALALSAIFIWTATLVPVAWPWLAAAAITLGVGVVFGRERMRTAPGPSGAIAVRQGLERAIADVDHQIHLLGSVATWYLTPLGVVAGCVLLGTILGVRQELPADVWARAGTALVGVLAVAAAIVAGMFYCVLWLNRRAVVTVLRPHRAQLVQALTQLADETDEADDARSLIGRTGAIR